jgi:VanZ family protein
MKSKYLINHTYLKIYFLIGIFFIITVFYYSLIPIEEEILPEIYSDKLIHFCVYFFLTKWFCDLFQKKYFDIVVFFLFSQGILIELLQAQTNYRSYETMDIVANTAGSVFSLILLSFNIISQVDKILLNFRKK